MLVLLIVELEGKKFTSYVNIDNGIHKPKRICNLHFYFSKSR